MSTMGEKRELEKTLGYKAILLITINSIMGTGIFFLPAIGAKYAGPSSLIAWAIMAVIAIYTSMCFAELTSMFPKSGGIYEFAKQAYGRTISFFIGWTTLIAGYITIAMLIIGAIQYIFPTENTYLIVGLASIFIILFNYVTYSGMKTSATMLIAFACITLATLFGLIIPALSKMNFDYLTPFFVEPLYPAGIGVIFLATFKVAETFFGWETATFLAGETKDGGKVVPRALVNSTIIISIVVLLFVFTSLTSIPHAIFGESLTPLSDLAREHYGAGAGITIFSMLIYLSIIGSVAGWIVSAPRLILSLSEDNLFIKQFSHISKKFGTPSYAIIFQTVVILVFLIAGAGSYNTLLHLLVPMLLVLYSFVMLTVVILRKKMPYVKRHYVAPYGTVGPYILVALYISLIVMWLVSEYGAVKMVLLGLSFIGVGIPFYLLILVLNDSDFNLRIKDLTAYYTLLFESVFVPKHIQKEIQSYLGDINAKTVLEYGSSVGTLTKSLLKQVGPRGKVISINGSRTELRILENRVKQSQDKDLDKMFGSLSIIHHRQYHNSVHDTIPEVDAIISLDTLSTMQNPDKVLAELSKLLGERSPICFFDFGNFFNFLPDQEWLSTKESITRKFREAGFIVNVRKKKGLFWNYMFIYGLKSRSDIRMV